MDIFIEPWKIYVYSKLLITINIMDFPNWTTIYLLYYTDTISNKEKRIIPHK